MRSPLSSQGSHILLMRYAMAYKIHTHAHTHSSFIHSCLPNMFHLRSVAASLWMLYLLLATHQHFGTVNGFSGNAAWNGPSSRIGYQRLTQEGASPPRILLFPNTALASSSDNLSRSEKRSMRIRSSLNLPLAVGSFYGALGLATLHAVRRKWITAMESTLGCSSLWIGFVLAISFTEAWVKFQAPFLPRYYGLDVGRTVFPVLNAVEVAFCSTIWLVQTTAATLHSARLLVAVTLILISQVVYLTPQLVLIGKDVIYEAFPEVDPTWSAQQEKMFEDLSMEVQENSRPSSKLHIVYILQEVAKVFLLGKFAWSCRNMVLR
jgi:hypothetical protein